MSSAVFPVQSPGLVHISPRRRASLILSLQPDAGGIDEPMRALNEARDALKDLAAV